MTDKIQELEIVKRRIERNWGKGEEAEIIAETIELLKQMQPRVLTLEEIRALPAGVDVWIEEGDGSIRVDTTEQTEDDRWFETVQLSHMLADYNVEWRAWTARPTEEEQQREEWT